jgi:hypothetical protein
MKFKTLVLVASVSILVVAFSSSHQQSKKVSIQNLILVKESSQRFSSAIVPRCEEGDLRGVVSGEVPHLDVSL